jgi:hypothetical protein
MAWERGDFCQVDTVCRSLGIWRVLRARGGILGCGARGLVKSWLFLLIAYVRLKFGAQSQEHVIGSFAGLGRDPKPHLANIT